VVSRVPPRLPLAAAVVGIVAPTDTHTDHHQCQESQQGQCDVEPSVVILLVPHLLLVPDLVESTAVLGVVVPAAVDLGVRVVLQRTDELAELVGLVGVLLRVPADGGLGQLVAARVAG